MITVGLIVGNRNFFPSALCKEGKINILRSLKKAGFKPIVLNAKQTKFGSVETYEDAKKCAELFKKHSKDIKGVIITLPNFGDERSVADSIRLSGLKVPILVHAFSDEKEKMGGMYRRDSFCGKISVCNNLSQYGIPFSLTEKHTSLPQSKSLRKDLAKFKIICKIISSLRFARFGQIGARPAAFNTVRYSEKILEKSGISSITLDLSEIIERSRTLSGSETVIKNNYNQIKKYVHTANIPNKSLIKMACFSLALEEYIQEEGLSGIAIQCWSSLQQYFGIMPCTIMSMLGNSLKSSACETDIAGLVGMHAMAMGSDEPSAILDWNNNYGDELDKAVIFHCSNIPKVFFESKPIMGFNEIISKGVGKENTFGTVTGKLKPSPVTYCRVSTDDCKGQVRAYLGEGEIIEDQIKSFGGYGTVKIENFNRLINYICKNGYEHHVAMNQSLIAEALFEAFTKYLQWNVYYHK